MFADEQKQICGKVIVDQLHFVAQTTEWPRWCLNVGFEKN